MRGKAAKKPNMLRQALLLLLAVVCLEIIVRHYLTRLFWRPQDQQQTIWTMLKRNCRMRLFAV